MIKKWMIHLIICGAILGPLLITARLWQVQKNNRVVTGESHHYADSGYIAPGKFGHGHIEADNYNFWYIYDRPTHPATDPIENGAEKRPVFKACIYGTVPKPEWDIDYVHYQARWYKLRGGHVTLKEGKLIMPPHPLPRIGLKITPMVPIDRVSLDRVQTFLSQLRYGSRSSR